MTAERDWDEAFEGLIADLNASTANCMHCLERIHRVPGRFCNGKPVWEDENGFPACVKGQLQVPEHPGQPGGAIARPPVLHEPMPRGLAGAPA